MAEFQNREDKARQDGVESGVATCSDFVNGKAACHVAKSTQGYLWKIKREEERKFL